MVGNTRCGLPAGDLFRNKNSIERAGRKWNLAGLGRAAPRVLLYMGSAASKPGWYLYYANVEGGFPSDYQGS